MTTYIDDTGDEYMDDPAGDREYDGDLYDGDLDYDDDDGLTDVEADAMTLASAGYGTHEDYGYYGDDEWS